MDLIEKYDDFNESKKSKISLDSEDIYRRMAHLIPEKELRKFAKEINDKNLDIDAMNKKEVIVFILKKMD